MCHYKLYQVLRAKSMNQSKTFKYSISKYSTTGVGKCLKRSPHSYSFMADISVSKLLVWQMTLKFHVVLMNYNNNYLLGFLNLSRTFVLAIHRLWNSFNTLKGIAIGKVFFCFSILECDLVIIHRLTEIAGLGLAHCSAFVEEDTQQKRTHSRDM